MGETICFASSKGGSGKTTLAATLGTFLAEVGFNVLLVDCDEGTHGLTLMYLDEVNRHRKNSDEPQFGIFELRDSKNAPKRDVSTVFLSENLSLVPARFVFSDFDVQAAELGFFDNLNDLICEHKSEYDFILLDAQAGISHASRSAMSPKNSDSVILVSEYDPMSNAGIERLKARLPKELDVARTWLLLNKLLPEFVAKFSEFLSVARYLPPIPWTADVVRAYSRRRLALDFKEGNQYTLGILAVVRELIDRENAGTLDDWLDQQTARLREPLAEQLHDARILLKNAREERKKLLIDRSSISRVLSVQVALISSGATALAAGLAFIDLAKFETYLRIFNDQSWGRAAFLVIAIGSMSSVLAVMFKFIESPQRTRRRQEYDDLALEVRNLERRVEELQELTSAHYEDIVANKAENGKSGRK